MTVLSPDKYLSASKCVECGAEISSKAKFCSECGALLVPSPNSSREQLGEALSEAKEPDEESSNIEGEPLVGIEPPRFGHEETVPEKQNTRVVIAGAVLLLITIVALLFTHHSKNPQSTPSAQSPEVIPQTGTASSAKESIHRLTPDTLSRVHELFNTKSPEWPLLLTLPEISQATERTFGDKASFFRECGTGSAALVGNLLAIQNCKSHACTDLGGILTVDLDIGNAAGALYDAAGTTIYLGDYKDATQTPSAIQDWVRDYRHGDTVLYQTTSTQKDASETPSVDFQHGVAIGIPRTPSAETPGAWVVDFGGSLYSGVTVSCVVGVNVKDGQEGPLRRGECEPVLQQGVPVRFHFIAADPHRLLYTAPDEFENPKPSQLSIWQASRRFPVFSSPVALGTGWSEIEGTATAITVHDSGVSIPGYRFQALNSSKTVDLECGHLGIIDRTNTRFNKVGMAMFGGAGDCVPLDKMNVVSLTTKDGKLYYFGVSNDEEEASRPYYSWVTTE